MDGDEKVSNYTQGIKKNLNKMEDKKVKVKVKYQSPRGSFVILFSFSLFDSWYMTILKKKIEEIKKKRKMKRKRKKKRV